MKRSDRSSRHRGPTHASDGLTREGQPRAMSRRNACAIVPRWAGHDARIQRFVKVLDKLS